MTDPRVTSHVVVSGRVQGVGFRAFVEHHARQRNLTGWVRNRRDGTVEAVFAGPQKSVEGMVDACGHGPVSAKVDAVTAREGTQADLDVSRGEGFLCLPTL
jgi:acylphosphatase